VVSHFVHTDTEPAYVDHPGVSVVERNGRSIDDGGERQSCWPSSPRRESVTGKADFSARFPVNVMRATSVRRPPSAVHIRVSSLADVPSVLTSPSTGTAALPNDLLGQGIDQSHRRARRVPPPSRQPPRTSDPHIGRQVCSSELFAHGCLVGPAIGLLQVLAEEGEHSLPCVGGGFLVFTESGDARQRL
jgi:hypothetical protein